MNTGNYCMCTNTPGLMFVEINIKLNYTISNT